VSRPPKTDPSREDGRENPPSTAEYLWKKSTGLGWRDRPLPKEKPLLSISADEISEYKDVFMLDDQALLFLNWLNCHMGRDKYFEFTRKLFNERPVTTKSFQESILAFLPSAKNDIYTWLYTIDYFKRLRLESCK